MVVAADDGIGAQTKEVIQLARDGGQEIVVAMTKIDKDGVRVDEARARISQELYTLGVVCDDKGGHDSIVPVSGLTGEGVNALIEMLLSQAEILDLRADDIVMKLRPLPLMLELIKCWA